MLTTRNIRDFFIAELHDERFIVDRTGSRTIEMLGASFFANEPAIFGKPNHEYIDRELAWYDSMSTNINDIYGSDRTARGWGRTAPKAWEYSANEHGEINSNYGLLIYGDEYFCQYDHVLDELLDNPNSRRACAIYNRPSIQVESRSNGKNDFICTNAVSYYIRDNQLHCVVQMRSNDVIFGYRNDYAWQYEVQRRLVEDLNSAHERMFDDPIEVGEMLWQVQNLHVYERHFDLVK